MGHAGIRLCHFSKYINHIVLEVSAKTIDAHKVKRQLYTIGIRFTIEEDSFEYFSYVFIPINNSQQIVSRLSVLSSHVQCITIDSLPSSATATIGNYSSYTHTVFLHQARLVHTQCFFYSFFIFFFFFSFSFFSLFFTFSLPTFLVIRQLSFVLALAHSLSAIVCPHSARVSYLLFHFSYLVFWFFFIAVKGIPWLELHERANHIKCRRQFSLHSV